MKYRLGFDIGIKSVGWAVIENDVMTEEPIRIVDVGVRTFDANEVDKTGESTAKTRRELRANRRRRRRKSFRKLRMINLLNKTFDINYELDIKEHLNDDIYKLRYEALDKRISNLELARIIISMLKKRGFKSNRKNITSNSDEGKLKLAIVSNQELIKKCNYRSIGEAIYKDPKFSLNINGKHVYNIRNHEKSYENCFYRDDLKSELELILNSQKDMGNNLISNEFINKVLTIFYTQRNFDEGPGWQSPYSFKESAFNVGICTFISSEKRAPKASSTFELFTALSKLNSLKLNGEELSCEQFDFLLNKILNYTEVKFSQIRKWLNIGYNKTFNLCSYYLKAKDKEGLSDNDIIDKCENKNKFVSFSNTNAIKKAIKISPNGNENLYDDIALMLSLCKSDSTIDSYLSQHTNKFSSLDESQINNIKCLNFDKFGSLSIVAMKKIIPFLIKGENYDEACKSAGFNHSFNNFEKLKYLKGEKIKERLQDIKSPTVKRAINQTIRILNEIIKKYGSPQFVTIELARDFERTPSERKNIENMQIFRFQENLNYIEEIMKYKSNPSGVDILKFRLYNEQDCKCLYSGETINLENLFADNYYQIDHVLPISRSLDDSYNNKVLVKTCENQRKGNLTPFEYFKKYKSENDWIEFVSRVNNLKNFSKRKNLLTEQFSENRQKDFIERNSNDTRYISRAMLNLLQDFLLTEPNKKYKKVIKSINGGVTAYLRKCWGVNKIREDGDVHHSIDACIIAVSTDSMVKNITEFNKKKELYIRKDDFLIDVTTGEKFQDEDIGKVLAMPYPNFVKEIEIRTKVKYMNRKYDDSEVKMLLDMGYIEEDLANLKPLFVSRMKNVKNTGPIHKETMFSTKAMKYCGKLIKTVELKDLKLSNQPEQVKIKGDTHPNVCIENYCKPLDDRKLYLLIKAKLIEDPEYFKKVPYLLKPSKNGEGIKVKKVKVYVNSSNITYINGGAFASEKMYRIDVFKKEDNFYAVPVYMKDVYAHKLPNKAIKAKKWIDLDDTFEFLFSLYQNDLIKVEWNKDVALKKVNDNPNSQKPKGIELDYGYFYYNSFDISNNSLKIYTCDRCYYYKSAGILNLKNISKYYVDIVGNVFKAPKEYRKDLWWMGYINIFLSSEARISIKNNQLTLINSNKSMDYPLEDLNCIMIDNPKTTISFTTLAKLAEYGILTFVCDNKHLPNGILLPFCNHYQTLTMYNNQITMSKPLQKNLWQTIIKNKIGNQNQILNICGFKDKLKPLANSVLSADSTNNEAKASAIYFKSLFGKNFSRKDNSIITNTLLNYGYSIIRGLVARSITIHGMLPFLGIFHHNQFNQFNLADDLIEVFRPLVDLFVNIELKNVFELNTDAKFKLCDLINYDVLIDNQNQTLNNAIDIFVESFAKSLNQKNNYLKYITINGLNRHKYE